MATTSTRDLLRRACLFAAMPAAAVDGLAALRRHPDAALAAVAHLGGVIAELSAEVAVRVHGLVERVRHRLQVLAVLGICPRNRQFSSLAAVLGLGLLPC